MLLILLNKLEHFFKINELHFLYIQYKNFNEVLEFCFQDEVCNIDVFSFQFLLFLGNPLLALD